MCINIQIIPFCQKSWCHTYLHTSSFRTFSHYQYVCRFLWWKSQKVRAVTLPLSFQCGKWCCNQGPKLTCLKMLGILKTYHAWIILYGHATVFCNIFIKVIRLLCFPAFLWQPYQVWVVMLKQMRLGLEPKTGSYSEHDPFKKKKNTTTKWSLVSLTHLLQ